MIDHDRIGARAETLEVLLRARGAAQLPHPGGTLLAHLKRTARRLETWDARPELILAGLCHAAYGTQGFPTPLFCVSERGLLRSHIGDEAEAIVYAYCADDRTESPSARTRLRDRFTGDEWVPAGWLGDALAELTAANELDIVEHAALGASELRASGMWAAACVARLTQASGAAVQAAACASGLWSSEPTAGGDREIAYRDLGASGARVVLWHGGAPPELTWSRQHVLSNTLSLRIPWRRGFAPSADASHQDWEADARDLLRIMPGRVHVVAHSYGALSALVAAANAPARFASLTLIEPPLWSVAADEPAVQRLVALSHAFVRGDRDAREGFLALAAMPSESSHRPLFPLFPSQHAGQEGAELLHHARGDLVTPVELDPGDLVSGLAPELAQPHRGIERQQRVAASVRLEDRQRAALRHSRRPHLLREQRARQQDESRERVRAAQRDVAAEHGALRKAAQHDLLIGDRKAQLGFPQQRFDRCMCRAEAFGFLERAVARFAPELRPLPCCEVDVPPRTSARPVLRQRQQRLGEHEARAARHLKNAPQGHEVIAAGAEAVQ